MRSLEMKFWRSGQRGSDVKGPCGPTFAAGSCVFEKEASCTGLLREFVVVW